MSKEFLQQLPLFAGLSEEDLNQLYEMAEPVSIVTGEYVMVEGEPGDALYVLLEGDLEVVKRIGQQDVQLNICHGGEILGEMALLN